MRIGASLAATGTTTRSQVTDVKNRLFTLKGYTEAERHTNDIWLEKGGNRMAEYDVEKNEDTRSEAQKIYEAVQKGENPLENLRQPTKVPYGHLAKDGIIDYNGVIFVCDEDTNSICLGDMTNKKNVLSITLSGGGHLLVNRDSIGQLAKAIGMFSPEDVNLILRAIALDTKLQSIQQELEDMENSVGDSLEQAQEAEAAGLEDY